MTATFTYTLPEERDEFRVACDAVEWKLAMVDVDTWLRNTRKYDHNFKSADEALDAARKELHEILDGYQLTLLD